jgi:hypothetical protein
MSIFTALLDNQFVQGVLVAGAGWLVNKIAGKKADTKAGKAGLALATSASLMAQYALTEQGKTAVEMITAFKGIVALSFARAGFTEAQRKPFAPMIDAAIAKAVQEWVQRHPAPSALVMPIAAKLPILAGLRTVL